MAQANVRAVQVTTQVRGDAGSARAGRPPSSPRRGAATLAACVAVIALGLWILAPRLAIPAPSLIDDWSAIDNSPGALDALVHLAYDPDAVGDPRRYRPAATAVWNALQWHTFDAPGGMVGPNAWNVLRLVLFAVALVALPVAVLGGSPRGSPGRAWVVLLAALPPAAILATPDFATDLARFGPAEPTLTSGMALGAALLILATGRWLRAARGVAVALGSLGLALWLLGVYQKEASVCFLVLVPFLYLFLDRRWRENGTIGRPLRRVQAAWVLGVLLVVPVLHMAMQVVRLAGRGQTVYGAPVPTGAAGIVDRLRESVDVQWGSMAGLLHTPVWRALAVALPFLLLAVALDRRRVPWLALGLAATGWAVLAFQGLGGEAASRYYLPTVALFGMAAMLALAQSPTWIRALTLAAGLGFVVPGSFSAREQVAQWGQIERDGTRAVGLVAEASPARCPVYLGGVGPEVADALPELVALRPRGPARPCDPRFAGLMLTPRTIDVARSRVDNDAILEACAGPGWVPVAGTADWVVVGCRRFRPGEVGGRPVSAVLDQGRLVPGRRYSERLEPG